MKVSIIIPCYNEEEGIDYLSGILSKLLPKIRKKYNIELIFVDDGSKDNTYKLLKKYFGKWKFMRILKHKKNMGFGAAFRTGIKNSTGDVIFQMDADCSYPVDNVMNMIADIGQYDVVTASPLHPKGKIGDVPFYRRVLSTSISKIYRLISGSNIHTFTCAFRTYKGDMLRNLKFESNGFTCAAEILLLLLIKKYKVKEFPSIVSNRLYGQSKMKTLKTIKEHLKLIMRILKIRIFGIGG
ncbi:glycosyltransferase family 2 protein [Candidatus Woesearchaeota archaeon]|nr:glycosyltransferase family 2 protein [Candidatus Woesearchaeota archaeon]